MWKLLWIYHLGKINIANCNLEYINEGIATREGEANCFKKWFFSYHQVKKCVFCIFYSSVKV